MSDKSYGPIDQLRDRRRQIQRLLRTIYAQQTLGMNMPGISNLLRALQYTALAYDDRARELGQKPLKSNRSSHYRTKHDSAKLLMPAQRRYAYATLIRDWFTIIDQTVKHDADMFPAGNPSYLKWNRGIRYAWKWLYEQKAKFTSETASR